MPDFQRFDLLFALRQTAFVTAIVLAPALVFAAVRGSRSQRLSLIPVVVGIWFLLFFLVISDSARVWGRSAVPITPLPIGPSYLSLVDIGRLVATRAWFPAGVVLLLWRWRRPAELRALATPLLVVFTLAAGCWSGVLIALVEYTHEDSMYAAGFSKHSWSQVRPGMTKTDVLRLLGPPLPAALQPEFATAKGGLCWVRNWSAGYYATVWFDNERVTRLRLWYSD